MNVYLLYETDTWLSTNSKELIGIFTNTKKMFSAVKHRMKDYFAENVLDTDINESVTAATRKMFDEFINNNYQTQTYHINFFAEIVETNTVL